MTIKKAIKLFQSTDTTLQDIATEYGTSRQNMAKILRKHLGNDMYMALSSSRRINTIVCLECGKQFQAKRSLNRKFCSTECFGKNYSKQLKSKK